MSVTTDDLKEIAHVVIVETVAGIRLVEFEREANPNPGMAAHEYANRVVLEDGFSGRVIVAARERTITMFAYLQAVEAGKGGVAS